MIGGEIQPLILSTFTAQFSVFSDRGTQTWGLATHRHATQGHATQTNAPQGRAHPGSYPPPPPARPHTQRTCTSKVTLCNRRAVIFMRPGFTSHHHIVDSPTIIQDCLPVSWFAHELELSQASCTECLNQGSELT